MKKQILKIKLVSYGELVMIDASEELRNTPKVNYNIQMSFKRVPNGKKNKVDH
jgi:hypothetical protein